MIKFNCPINLPNLANKRMHFMARANKVRAVQQVVAWQLLSKSKASERIMPATVTMTRLYPKRGKKLDSDNLSSAMKPVRDAIAKVVGVDDGDGQWEWICKQQQVDDNDYSVEVVIE